MNWDIVINNLDTNNSDLVNSFISTITEAYPGASINVSIGDNLLEVYVQNSGVVG